MDGHISFFVTILKFWGSILLRQVEGLEEIYINYFWNIKEENKVRQVELRIIYWVEL